MNWEDPKCFSCDGKLDLRKGRSRRRFVFCESEACPLAQTIRQWRNYRDLIVSKKIK